MMMNPFKKTLNKIKTWFAIRKLNKRILLSKVIRDGQFLVELKESNDGIGIILDFFAKSTENEWTPIDSITTWYSNLENEIHW